MHVANAAIVERLKADLAFHQAERDRLALELSELDEAYNAETDVSHSYHEGRVEAMQNAIDILLGRETELYSETQQEPEDNQDEVDAAIAAEEVRIQNDPDLPY